MTAAIGLVTARAEGVLEESFTYDDGPIVVQAADTWKNHSGTSAQAEVYEGQLILTQSGSEDFHAKLAGGPYKKSSGGTMYASFDVEFTELPRGDGSYFAHFRDDGFGYRARIIAQTVYYFVASAALGGCERPISFVVPTGNFGNIFAAYVAMKMGLPIEKLIVATNSNDILTRFFENGAMEKGEVTPTLAPSMDIQISSNFERYLFELFGRDSGVLNKAMADFADKGHFEVTKDQLDQALTLFDAGRASDAETLETIARIHREADLLMDPHSAIGLKVAYGQRDKNGANDVPIVSLACAHPAKFPDAVEKATGVHPALPNFLADLMGRDEHMDKLDNNLVSLQDYIKQKTS